MAKQTKDTLAKLHKLNDAVSKKLSASEKVGFDVFKKFPGITEYISSGSYIVNAVISGSLFGGVPNTRSIELAGKSGCLPGTEKIRIYVFKTKPSIGMTIEYEE